MTAEKEKMMDMVFARANKALEELASYTHEEIDALCVACCRAFDREAEKLAKLAVEETGLGKASDKIGKNKGAATSALYAINGVKTVGIIGEDPAHHVKFVGHPKGIVFCTTPTTNPNMAAFFNGLYALKGRNVFICSAHPRAKESSNRTCEIMQKAILEVGGPENVFQWLEESDSELSLEMMHRADLVLGISNMSMSQVGYRTGKPAYGVGHGNCQTIIDPEYDDFDKAVAETVLSSGFDNGLVCACTRALITPECITDQIVEKLKEHHVYYVDDPAIRDQIRQNVFPDGFGKIRKDLVGQSVQKVAELIGLNVPEDTSLIVVKVDTYGKEEPLCGEKLLPLMAHIVCKDVKDGIQIAKTNLQAEGIGHLSSIYTNNQELCEYMGTELPISRVVINYPSIQIANPKKNIGMVPTATPCSGSWVDCAISENLGPRHFINISRISWTYPVEEVPSEEDIWSGKAMFYNA